MSDRTELHRARVAQGLGAEGRQGVRKVGIA